MAGTAGDDSRHTQLLYALLTAVCVLALVSMFMGVLEGRAHVVLISALVASVMMLVYRLVRRSERD